MRAQARRQWARSRRTATAASPATSRPAVTAVNSAWVRCLACFLAFLHSFLVLLLIAVQFCRFGASVRAWAAAGPVGNRADRLARLDLRAVAGGARCHGSHALAVGHIVRGGCAFHRQD